MNKWINDIRHRFEGHTQEPPKGLLDDIKVEMVRRGLVSASPSVSSHVGKSSKWWAAAASVAVIIAGVGVWWLRSSAPETNALVSQQQPKETAKQGQRDAETLTLHENVPQTTMSWWAKKKNNRVISALGMTETAMASTSENNMVESQAVVNSTDSTSQKPTKRPVTKDETYSNPTEILSQRLVSSTPQRLTFDVYMSGRGMSTQAIGNAFNHGIVSDVMANPNENGHYLSSAPGLSTKQYHHHLPIKIGVSVGRKLSNDWAIHTGLTYSFLSASITNQGKEQGEEGQQRLHYIGVPLSVSYRLWQYKRLNAYATAGGEVEKLVKGQLRLPQPAMKSDFSPKTIDLKESPLQWAVNASLGLEYRINNNTGFYVEPGMSHYFNNGSDIENSYKHRPTGFQIQLGIRIHTSK